MLRKIKNLYLLLLNKFNRDLFIQNIALISSGSFLSRLIGLFTAPLITRLYSPDEYGILSVFTAIIGVAGSLSTLRYAVTIPLAEKEETADNLLKLSFLITLLLSLFIFLIVFFFGETIAFSFSLQSIQPYFWILPICFLGVGLYEALSSWATRKKHFKLITKTILSQSISSRLIKIGLGLIGVKPLGLLIGFVASQVAGSGNLMLKLLKEKPFFLKKFSLLEIREAAVRYFRFPLFQTPSQLLLSFGANLPTIFLVNIFDAKTAGFYGLAYGMVSLPMNLFGNAISQVYYAEIAKIGKLNSEKIYKLTLSVIKKLFITSFFPALLLGLFGPWLFSIFFGKNWYDAGIYARLLSLVILFRFVSTPIMHCLNVLEKQGYQLILNIIRVTTVVCVFIITRLLNWDASTCIMIYSAIISLFYAMIIFLVVRILKINSILK